ncbi:MAG: hypothetical protein WA628_07540 [Terriglobales bacterium]
MTSRALTILHLVRGDATASLVGRGETMFSHAIRRPLLLSLIVYFSSLGPAQSSAQDTNPPSPEVVSGGYVIHQSTEFGVRVSDTTGSRAMYDSLVNLQTGPRVFDQMLSLRSENHQGILFDNLLIRSIGWGGDPNNYLRFNLDKDKWYDFRASFRRDQDFFNYDLFANPLNPTTSVPNVPVGSSPHSFETRRRMSDFDLTLLPRSYLSFRLGYSRNNMTGPSYSSIHEGTDAYLYQPWNTTLNSYRAGVDWRFMPRTVLSYDQFLDYYKGDTSWELANFYSLPLSSGASVDLGLPFNSVASQPCATPVLAGDLANPACNGTFSYNRLQQTRNSFTTERLSLRSNYWSRLDLAANLSYSGGDASIPSFNELFDGLITRSRTRAFLETGSTSGRRVTAMAESGVTFHVTDRFRLVNSFLFNNFRIPGGWNMPTTTLFGATLLSTPNTFSPATCPPPFTAATCPQHNASSGPDVINDLRNDFLGQDLKRNTFELQYDFTRKLSGRIGYRYDHRRIAHSVNDIQDQTFFPSLPNRGACAGQPLVNGICAITVTESASDLYDIRGHGLLAGISARPSTALRLNFDLERLWTDNSLTRISPRKEARYRFQSTYLLRPWAVLSGSLNLLETANGDSLTDYQGHNRNYGFTATITPRERFGFDFAYNYNDYQQDAFICFNDTPPTGVTLPVVTNAGSCLVNDSSNPLLTKGYYLNNSHYGMSAVTFKLVKRVTTLVGYSITKVGGATPQFNSLQPDGSLQYSYHLPLASFSIDLGHNLAWKAGWNYYQYKEGSFVGPTDPRYFHATNATVSLGWAF